MFELVLLVCIHGFSARCYDPHIVARYPTRAECMEVLSATKLAASGSGDYSHILTCVRVP